MDKIWRSLLTMATLRDSMSKGAPLRKHPSLKCYKLLIILNIGSLAEV